MSETPEGRVILLLYVDDMIISGMGTIHKIKQKLNNTFEMKDLGFLRYFLELKIAYSLRGYLLSHLKYAYEIVSQARLKNDTKRAHAPLEFNVKFQATDGEALPNPTFYRQQVGKLIYLTISRDTHHPALFFSSSTSLELRAYTDSYFVGNLSDHKSTT
ncbi:uncharacterized protein LOC110007309 [Amborella trichopoda]|uniref:uncharacterized protein LOC110007309 n=1 Tax=Amborella trichopoda TaxID=13333 RepID=UPI0009C170B9|nr:uncharacterized protein LOC110007309 [Amborella trichopoda]|eukprot:XP_020523138.1 uncharacterized protein LOC110007309 [Amborella trichopoda]